MKDYSVIIAAFNYGRFIDEAIEGVLAQTLPAAEIVVIDDGSTDGTAEVVAGFGDRVRYVRQENQGVSAARNRGVRETTGEFIAFLDADDIWEPTKLEKQVAVFEMDKEIGLVHCGMREFDSETGETLELHTEGGEGWVSTDIAAWEKPVIIGPGGSIVVRRAAFDQVGGFDTKLKNGEDWEFCFRLARKYKVGFVAEPLVHYRNHGANATKNVREMEQSTLLAWAKVFETEDEDILAIRRASYGRLYKVLAGSYLHGGDYSGFLRNVFKSLYYRPGYIGFYLRSIFERNSTPHK